MGEKYRDTFSWENRFFQDEEKLVYIPIRDVQAIFFQNGKTCYKDKAYLKKEDANGMCFVSFSVKLFYVQFSWTTNTLCHLLHG